MSRKRGMEASVTVRWRLAVFVLQIGVILVSAYTLTGSLVSSAAWYSSLLAIAMNSMLLEPFFPRPADVLCNSAVGLVLYSVATKTVAAPGWNVLAYVLVVGVALSLVALVFGANKSEGRLLPLGRASKILSSAYTAKAIYTATFWLSVLDDTGGFISAMWPYSNAWLCLLAIGAVNWQAVWATTRGGPAPVVPEGFIGPSKLLIAGPAMPALGTAVALSDGVTRATGTVLARVPRPSDVWAAIHLESPTACESLLSAKALTIEASTSDGSEVLGIVDAATTNSTLVFSPTRTLRIGEIVAASSELGLVLYQISKAEVIDLHVKGGGHLAVRAHAYQLGILQPSRLVRHRWVPDPGSAVIRPPDNAYEGVKGDGRFLMGHLIGTKIPVFMDPQVLCEGHLAILGMTRMGKTTLAIRLAKFLSTSRAVVVMDQTGEYRSKQNFNQYDAAKHDDVASLSVFEPAPGKPTPDEGLSHLKHLANKGYAEYKQGTPFSRVLVVDEAHQFVPEPALLGFGAPGRESAITFGMHAMQVRKYGLTLTLVSQRTAVLAKTALSQCENVIAFRSVDQTGLDYLEAVLGAQAREILPNLQQGEALVSGPSVSSDFPVAITLIAQEQEVK